MSRSFDEVIYHITRDSITVSLGSQTITVKSETKVYSRLKKALMTKDITETQRIVGSFSVKTITDKLGIDI
jgi:hypothetical protein